MNTLKNNLKSDNYYLWIFFAVAIKLILWILYFQYHIYVTGQKTDFYGVLSGDSYSYILPVERFYRQGVYALHNHPETGMPVPYSGRMPGLGIIFLFFRSFLSYNNSLNGVIITQLIISGISAYFIGRICERVGKHSTFFFIGYFLFLINTFISLYDYSIMNESLFISFFIIGSYLVLFCIKNRFIAIGAGFLFAWMFFLRPFTLPILIWTAFWILKEAPKKLLVFIIPVILADATWVIRNYINQKKVIFTQSDIWAGYNYPKSRVALFKWIQIWGGDIVWWNPKAEVGAFFRSPSLQGLPHTYDKIEDLPEYAFCGTYTGKDLLEWKSKYDSVEKNPKKYRNTVWEKELVAQMSEFKHDYLQNRPVSAYLGAYARLLKSFLIHSGTTNFARKPFNQLSIHQKILKIGYSFLYIIFVPFGILISVIVFFTKLKFFFGNSLPPIYYFVCVNIGMLALFMLMRFIEYRYLLIFYPCGMIITAYYLGIIYSLVKKK